MRRIILLLHLSILFIALPGPASAQGFREPLLPGSEAPEISGTDQYGNTVSLHGSLADGRSAVLIFYRGSWCPYCVKHLAAVQDSLSMILDAGASVIVVTPERPESAERIIGRTGAEFSILHDADYSIMKAYQVDFVIAGETVPRAYGFVEKHTAEANGNDEGVLPVPATYVIGSDGRIRWVQYDPDYRVRSSIADILEALD